MAVRIPTRVL